MQDPYTIKLATCSQRDWFSVSPKLVKTKRDNNKVLQYARYFLRESGYDFLQYDDNDYRSPETKSFLISDSRYIAGWVGAACFRWVEWKDHEPCWILDWVWIHPFFRNKGVLEGSWPNFFHYIDGFIVSTPISGAMQRFLDKHNDGSRYCGNLKD